MSKELLFYDIECFKYDSLVVFKRLDHSVHSYYWYSDDIKKYSQEIAIILRDHLMAGYNNFYYDDQIIEHMKRGESQEEIKSANDAIIGGDNYTALEVAFDSIDMFQQIDVAKPSLKQIEGNMGKSILETSVPFDIDRKLTDQEREDVLKYCMYDVDSTISVYELRKKSYFDVKQELLTMCNKPYANKWNTTSIVADILIPDAAAYRSYKYNKTTARVTALETPISFIPKGAWNVWCRAKNEDVPRDASYTVSCFGLNNKDYCDVVFGFGGLHGAPVKPWESDNLKPIRLLDVGSMYPSIIVRENLLGNSTELYNQIRLERLSIKKSDPLRANALKLILNSTYGLLKNQYSKLKNPKAANDVCIYGQIALYDLCIRLDKLGYRIININTDGVAFEDNLYQFGDFWEDIKTEWEQDYKLTLECETFKKWIQRDVNNYVAVRPDDSIKVKGGDVNLALKNEYFKNNSARIIDMAVVYGLLHRNDEDWQGEMNVLQFLYDHTNEPMLFQYILKAGGTFKGVYDVRGNKMQNVNRVFAIKSGDSRATSLRKVRKDGGYVKFPNAPDRMYVWNDDCDKIEDFASWVDLNHYSKIIMSKLKAWEVKH